MIKGPITGSFYIATFMTSLWSFKIQSMVYNGISYKYIYTDNARVYLLYLSIVLLYLHRLPITQGSL